MSCVVEISHVFQIYFGICAGTYTRDITSFSSVIEQKDQVDKTFISKANLRIFFVVLELLQTLNPMQK
jgi:hypothetical protein